MVRKLKFHEEKLLKKVDFISWEVDNNLHEVKILKRYRIQKREDYTKYYSYYIFISECITDVQISRYNKLSRQIRETANKIKELDPKDPFRVDASANLLEKL